MANLKQQIGLFLVAVMISPVASAALKFSYNTTNYPLNPNGYASFGDAPGDDLIGSPVNYHYRGSGIDQDVIGTPAIYNNRSVEARLQESGEIEVRVYTEYAGAQSYEPYKYGDLFFDTSWDLDGTLNNHLLNDDRYNGQWQYVVHMDDRWRGDQNETWTGEDAFVYSIDYNTDDPRVSTAGGRPGPAQEWRISDVDQDPLTLLQDSISNDPQKGASWSVYGAEDVDYLAYHFNLQEIGLPFEEGDLPFGDTNFQLAFHWTMSCGNDVSEGILDFTVRKPPEDIQAPEPASLALFAIGLVGVARLRRRQLARA